MSRTNHTTPSFPRTLRGPRGGRHIAPTPCAECVSFTSCRPGACSAPFGCESWVDQDGRRVEPDPRPDYDAPDDGPFVPRTAEEIDASIDGRGPDPADFDDFTLTDDQLDHLEAIVERNATPEQTNDPGPLFAGR